VGDYGKLDEQAGGFNREGNVYDDTHIYTDENIAQLVRDHPPKVAAREDVYIAASRTVKRSDLTVGTGM
jgi:predicted RNase H-like nuclease